MYTLTDTKKQILNIILFTIYLIGSVGLGIFTSHFINVSSLEEKYVSLTDLKLYKTPTTRDVAYININKDAFIPAEVAVTEGQNVTWTNNDMVPHTVTYDPFPNDSKEEFFNSGALAPGESFTYTFATKGNYTYHDETNPLEIKGTVTVR